MKNDKEKKRWIQKKEKENAKKLETRNHMRSLFAFASKFRY